MAIHTQSGLGVFLALGIWIGIGWADDTPSSVISAASDNYVEVERLDALLEALKNANSEYHARQIENMIMEVWTSPLNEELAARMVAFQEARRWRDTDRAIRILNEITERWDGYAEAYNQRAYMYFLKGEYEKALIDIAETLSREPRHFGSMAGRGVIRLRQGKQALAMQNIIRAMEYHPYIRERALFPQLISQ